MLFPGAEEKDLPKLNLSNEAGSSFEGSRKRMKKLNISGNCQRDFRFLSEMTKKLQNKIQHCQTQSESRNVFLGNFEFFLL